MGENNGKTKEILEKFTEIAKIPRCSKHEELIGEYLVNWAKDNHLTCRRDDVGNVAIDIPASKGYEKSPGVIIQGHVDMVCEKTKDSVHDFSKDPIELVQDGDWIKAKDTSLGADNGIAVAIGMVLATEKSLVHPPMELFFTVDEETGLTGAVALKPGFLKGKILLNIDSEDEGYFTIGCAGGMNTSVEIPLESKPFSKDLIMFKITVGGLKGGHSGIDINKEKGNAIKLLSRSLSMLQKNIGFNLISYEGGTAHNAIPRMTESVISLNKDDRIQATKILNEAETVFRSEYKSVDPDISLTIEEVSSQPCKEIISDACTKKVIDFVLAYPNGVSAMSTDITGLVETSDNLAKVSIKDKKFSCLSSQRSSKISRLHELTRRIEAVAGLAGGLAKSSDGYPPWQPNLDSKLLAKCIEIYTKLFDKKPIVEIIHAGLECGIIGDKYPGMDMISIGPTLRFPHSPDEKLFVPSIGKVWKFLSELLKSLK